MKENHKRCHQIQGTKFAAFQHHGQLRCQASAWTGRGSTGRGSTGSKSGKQKDLLMWITTHIVRRHLSIRRISRCRAPTVMTGWQKGARKWSVLLMECTGAIKIQHNEQGRPWPVLVKPFRIQHSSRQPWNEVAIKLNIMIPVFKSNTTAWHNRRPND